MVNTEILSPEGMRYDLFHICTEFYILCQLLFLGKVPLLFNGTKDNILLWSHFTVIRTT